MGILYGHRCILCGADFPVTTSRTLQLCPDCAAAIRREYRCNEVISIAGADGTIAPLYYRGAVRSAMKRFKFNGAAYCADWFAAQMSVALTARLDDWQPDLITYMPIGFLHYRKRGYNQAELLAKLTAKPLSLPCEATLRKRWFVGKQSAQKDYAARQSNAKDAVLPKGSVDLTGKSVVLVDDIIKMCIRDRSLFLLPTRRMRRCASSTPTARREKCAATASAAWASTCMTTA